MKTLKLASILILLGSLSACVMKTKVLDAGAVSMTHSSLAPGQKLHEVGPVTGQFCTNTFSDKGNIGLIDSAVKSAQSKYSVDFITNASFYTDGNGCMSVEGTGQKIISSNEASNSGDTMIKGKTKKR